MLKFQNDNAKLNKSIYNVCSFRLPAGYACPAAVDCLAKANRYTGRITDGENAHIRCFAATDEARSPQARDARWFNFDALRGLGRREMAHLIHTSLPIRQGTIRIHVSGDFYNQSYFDAWVIVATLNPDIHFYAYTKAINFWMACKAEIPVNLNLTASRGGTHDWLIAMNQLKEAIVVFHPDEAERMGLAIDHDDSLAMHGTSSFALLLHGTQPAKSKASVALSAMRKEGVQFSYAK